MDNITKDFISTVYVTKENKYNYSAITYLEKVRKLEIELIDLMIAHDSIVLDNKIEDLEYPSYHEVSKMMSSVWKFYLQFAIWTIGLIISVLIARQGLYVGYIGIFIFSQILTKMPVLYSEKYDAERKILEREYIFKRQENLKEIKRLRNSIIAKEKIEQISPLAKELDELLKNGHHYFENFDYQVDNRIVEFRKRYKI